MTLLKSSIFILHKPIDKLNSSKTHVESKPKILLLIVKPLIDIFSTHSKFAYCY